MTETVEVAFQGPFYWGSENRSESVFFSDIADAAGIYLWTANLPEGELVYYVGETARTFKVRMWEHFREQVSGMYMLYEPSAFVQGKKEIAWEGMWWRGKQERVPEFLEILPQLAPAIVGFCRSIRFFLAPLDCDDRIRKRIEGALYDNFNSQDGIVGEFQDRGLRYIRRRDDEEPVQARFQSPCKIIGLPDSMDV